MKCSFHKCEFTSNNTNMFINDGGLIVCPEHSFFCNDCEKWYGKWNLTLEFFHESKISKVCTNCSKHYIRCITCNKYYKPNGQDRCDACIESTQQYNKCSNCKRYYNKQNFTTFDSKLNRCIYCYSVCYRCNTRVNIEDIKEVFIDYQQFLCQPCYKYITTCTNCGKKQETGLNINEYGSSDTRLCDSCVKKCSICNKSMSSSQFKHDGNEICAECNYALNESEQNAGPILNELQQNSKKWTKILLSLGFQGIHDSGYGFLHQNEKTQGVALSSQGIQLITTVLNPKTPKDIKIHEKTPSDIKHKLIEKFIDAGGIPSNKILQKINPNTLPPELFDTLSQIYDAIRIFAPKLTKKEYIVHYLEKNIGNHTNIDSKLLDKIKNNYPLLKKIYKSSESRTVLNYLPTDQLVDLFKEIDNVQTLPERADIFAAIHAKENDGKFIEKIGLSVFKLYSRILQDYISSIGVYLFRLDPIKTIKLIRDYSTTDLESFDIETTRKMIDIIKSNDELSSRTDLLKTCEEHIGERLFEIEDFINFLNASYENTRLPRWPHIKEKITRFATEESIFDFLVSSQNQELAAELCDPKFLYKLITDPDKHIRALVAKRIPEEFLPAFINDESGHVRAITAKRITRPQLPLMIKDKHPLVKKIIKQRVQSEKTASLQLKLDKYYRHASLLKFAQLNPYKFEVLVPRALTFTSLNDYVDKPYHYIHFTDTPMLMGLNPKYSYGNPIGVYGYPLTSDIYKKALSGGLPFASDRKFITLYKIEGRVLDFDSYTDADLNSDVSKLQQLYPDKQQFINHAFLMSKRYALKQLPGCRLYYITLVLSSSIEEPKLRKKLWRRYD